MSAPTSAVRGVGSSAAAKVLTMGTTAVVGILTTRLILQNYGHEAYAQYGLIVSIALLIPFADLGMGAALMNAIGGSDDPRHDEAVRRVLITSIRVLVVGATVLVTGALALGALGLWPTLLGDGLMPDSGPTAATLALCLIALAMPLGIGQRVLTGLGKNHIAIIIGGFQAPIVLALVGCAVWQGWDIAAFLPTIPYAIAIALAACATVIGRRKLLPVAKGVIRAASRVRTERGAVVMNVAWPTILMSAVLPLGMQSDRIILSHVAGVEQLATYNLAAQIFTPVWALVAASGMSLWPVFARSRATAAVVNPYPIAVFFGLGAAAVSLVLAAATPWLTELASDGAITVPWSVVFAFVALMTMQGLKFPLGMFMTDAAGLKFQAIMVTVMAPINVALSFVLAGQLGAVGPVIGSAISVAIFQVAANFWYVRRRLRREAGQVHRQAGSAEPAVGAGAER